jgi:hypothetical protein
MDWKDRALRAEQALRDIAAIPNDSLGWRLMRKRIAQEYIMAEQPPLFYLRNAPDDQFAAEFCWRGDDDVYHTMQISDNMLLNFLKESARIISQRGIWKLDIPDSLLQNQHQQSTE